jgi:hypothetical protein
MDGDATATCSSIEAGARFPYNSPRPIRQVAMNLKEDSMKKALTLFSLFLVLAVAASADIYVKSKTHTDAFAMMGQNQPAKDETSEQWFNDDQLTFINPETTIIVDLKKNIIDIINNKQKTYIESALPFDFAKILDPQMAQMMGQMMKMTVTAAPNNQTKTVGQWKCAGYDVTINMMMMPVKLAVWASTDVPFDLAKFQNLYMNVMKAQMRLDEASVKEMMKVKGYWIASETSMEMMGAKMRTTSEVVEITKKTPPASAYSVPTGYTKKDKLSMQDMQNK